MGNNQSAEQQQTDIYQTAEDMSELPQQLSRIDAPLERRRVGDMEVDKFAGLTFREYREAIEFSKLIAQAKHGIPPYLRNNPGDCLVICTQALRWKLEPSWCMQHSFIAKNESLLAYDSAVHNAIVLASGLLKGRPRYTYSGEGDDLTCTVTACFRGEMEPHEYTTPPLRQCRPPKNQEGIIKGSPLWSRDPQQQLGYFAIRNWGRRYMPEILGGVYDSDEFENTTQEESPAVIPPSPDLMSRLPGRIGETGFHADVVDAGLARKAEAPKAASAPQEPADAPEPPPPPQVAPEAPTPPSEPREADSEPPELVPPVNAEQYVAYANGWIKHGTETTGMTIRWERERELRAALKIPVTVRKRLKETLLNRLDNLRKGEKDGRRGGKR